MIQFNNISYIDYMQLNVFLKNQLVNDQKLMWDWFKMVSG